MFTMRLVGLSYETRLFRYLCDYAMFLESVTWEIHNLWGPLFFQIVKKLIQISETQKKSEKKFFVFDIIASELVSLNCIY